MRRPNKLTKTVIRVVRKTKSFGFLLESMNDANIVLGKFYEIPRVKRTDPYTTGPNTSSVLSFDSCGTSVKIVGWMKYPYRANVELKRITLWEVNSPCLQHGCRQVRAFHPSCRCR